MAPDGAEEVARGFQTELCFGGVAEADLALLITSTPLDMELASPSRLCSGISG